jgi:hypothetical protein
MTTMLVAAVLSLTPAPEPEPIPAPWQPTLEEILEWKRHVEDTDGLLRELSTRLGKKDPRPPLARPIAPPTWKEWRDWQKFLDGERGARP